MKKSDRSRDRIFTRRAAILGLVQGSMVGVLAGRLYFLQVHEADRYATLAEENRINIRLLPPARGRILDQYGTAIALNRQTYKVMLVPEQTMDAKETFAALSQLISVNENDRRRIAREIGRRRAFVPITIRDDLSWDEVASIELNAPELPGIIIDAGQSRFYPQGSTAAHVLGYVSIVAEGEQTGDPLLELPDFRVGKNGVERRYDKIMRGKAGTSEVEVNALGRVVRELHRHEGGAGNDIVLTLDIELQKFVMGRLPSEGAAAVVLDIHSGEVLSMASTPSYDPNRFSNGIAVNEWQELISDPRTPLVNKAIHGQYAPGSTFKIIVALAALEAGMQLDFTATCPGYKEIGGSRFHCWKHDGHGEIDLYRAMAGSCDVFFYELGLKIGVDRMAAMARRLGLGSLLGIDLPGEASGFVPTREWKRSVLNQPWWQGDTLITSIGQGAVLGTPLQLAMMAARVANGGKAITPHVMREIRDGTTVVQSISSPNTLVSHLGISRESLDVVMKAMNGVVNEPGGTAYGSRITMPGFSMAGKTGTSQVRRITAAEREAGIKTNDELPWAQRDHAVFVAFGPVTQPRYACAVVVEHGGSGAKVAAPIARDILLELQKRDILRHNATPVAVGAG
ncbi:MAG: penicillin-binding protein 2 [Alphaproteobacteria bacterium]